MVRRLRSRPHRPEGHRRRACPRAFARERGAGGEGRGAARRPQQRGARDERRRMKPATPPSIPALRAARAGSRRASSSPRSGPITAFSTSNTSAFDLTRPRREGPPHRGRGRRLSLYRARRLPHGRDGVRDSALARRQGQRPSPGLPLTLVVKRPDGVEYRRANSRGPGPRRTRPRRCRSCPAPCAAPGGSRPTRTRRAPSVGETSFLVEDYVPERLEVTLTPRQAALRPGEPAQIDLLRPLSLRRAGRQSRRDRRGRRRHEHRERHQGARRISRSGSTTRRSRPRPSRSRQETKTDGQGRAALQTAGPGGRSARIPWRRASPSASQNPAAGRVERAVTVPILPDGAGRSAVQKALRR